MQDVLFVSVIGLGQIVAAALLMLWSDWVLFLIVAAVVLSFTSTQELEPPALIGSTVVVAGVVTTRDGVLPRVVFWPHSYSLPLDASATARMIPTATPRTPR